VDNARLGALLEQAGVSHTALAKRVSDGCARRRVPRSYTATSVEGWLRGRTPQDPAPVVIAEVLSVRLGRPVGVLELGFAVTPLPEHLGLGYPVAVRDTVDAVVAMWEADMLRRDFLAGAGALAGAFSAPVRDWLVAGQESVAFSGTARRVGATDVDVLWSMCRTFQEADRRLGGGHARATLMTYAHDHVRPLLHASYDDAVGRDLYRATACLVETGAFMAFDTGRHGLAQRYYIQALRLAQAAGDHVLGSYVLGSMSIMDHQLGDGREALAQARAGQRAALAGPRKSYAAYSKCLAQEAKAHALLADRPAAEQALAKAETALDRVHPEDEPFWVSAYISDFHADAAFAAADLRRSADTQRHAALASTPGDGRERRRALVLAAVAESHLTGGTSEVDVTESTRVANEALELAARMESARVLDLITHLRRRLATQHPTHPDAQAFEDRARALLPNTA